MRKFVSNIFPPESRDRIVTLANGITASRLVLCTAAAIDIALNGPSPRAGATLSVWFLTDALDGWTARKMGQESQFWKRLDPVVDALSFTGVMLVLIATNQNLVEKWVLTWILLTHVVYMWKMSHEWTKLWNTQNDLGPSMTAKIKTAINMASLVTLSAVPNTESQYGNIANMVGTGGLTIGTLLTLYCGISYLQKAKKVSKEGMASE
jgi:CDP-diacylglycerol---glycerol-3-phosphate 3-phosphatidyltransferase